MLFCPKFTYYYNKLQVSGQKKSPYAWFLTSLPVVLPFSHRVEMPFAPTDGPVFQNESNLAENPCKVSVFAHVGKWSFLALGTGFSATLRGAIEKTLWSDGENPTGCLAKWRAASVNFAGRKVCKNGQKVRFL